MRVRTVRTGPHLLTVVIENLDNQIVEVQRQIGPDWETVTTFVATLVSRIDGLPSGQGYRVMVPDSPRFTGGVSGTIWF